MKMNTTRVNGALFAIICIAVISGTSGESPRRGNTRPKIANGGNSDAAADENANIPNTDSETEVTDSQFKSRTRPKRFFENSRPKRSLEADKREEMLLDGLKRLLQEYAQVSRQRLADKRSMMRDDDDALDLVLKLWEEFCEQDNLKFDLESVSCVEDGGGNVPDRRAWGNPGGVPGK